MIHTKSFSQMCNALALVQIGRIRSIRVVFFDSSVLLFSLSQSALALILAFLFGLPLATTGRAQDGGDDRGYVPSEQRVSPNARRESDIDGNSVRTTIFNFGMSGRTGGGAVGEVPYEWPKNTNRHYIALVGFFAGAETASESGEPIWIVDVPNYRINPNNDNSWAFEPIPGFAAASAESIARSDQPSTWPNCWPDKQDAESDPGWCGSWNGYFGKDVFNADQEFFYRMGDDNYRRYTREIASQKYYPDSTDLSRGGLGLVVDTRALAWSQILIDDAVFFLHGVTNDGTQDLRRVGVTLWLADLVGGDGDAGDDQPSYDLLEDVALMTDSDGQGNQEFGNTEPGVASASFLETPGNAVDRIDNDGDGTTGADISNVNQQGLSVGEPGSPVITSDLLDGECPSAEVEGRLPSTCYDGLDNNDNGLIDENRTYVPFQQQEGVGYADYVDNDGDGETGSPTVTQEMVNTASNDRWNHWPTAADRLDGAQVHLIGLGDDDVGQAFVDGIDNNETASNPMNARAEEGSPTVTAAMIEEASGDPYRRYRVTGTDVVLYQLGPEDEGKPYADGIDNDDDGAVDEGIDENIDEMIDESRADGIDNDGDWRSGLDDLGLDGAEFSGDAGEGDGVPTTGADTGLPGEPNIDKTDVSESDQIGITNVQYDEAGGINYNTVSDRQLFRDFMAPGSFYNPNTSLEGDYDLFVSSGTFPLQAGQTERISYSIIMGQTEDAVLRKRQNAVEAYEADYQFAQAPATPTLEAVPGDGRVTLYWDDEAESSYDSFIADLQLGLNPNDFEGYRIYRSTDPSFLDARVITDGYGNSQFLKPIAQFDVNDDRSGFHPIAIDGVKFNMGTDSGLQHVYEDTTAVNGVQYYYAVTAYDFGAVFSEDNPGEGSPPNTSTDGALINGIPPSETPVLVTFQQDGTVETGSNVVQVSPTERAAGYQEGRLAEDQDGFLPQISGNTTSRIGYEIIDPRALEDGHAYRVVFEDTLSASGEEEAETLTTQNVSLIDVTDQDTVLAHSKAFREGNTAPVTEGFRLNFFPDPFVVIDTSGTGWPEAPGNYGLEVSPFVNVPAGLRGVRNPADYRIEVGPPGSGQATELEVGSITLPVRPTNVRVYNTSRDTEIDYAYVDRTGDAGGVTGGVTGTEPAQFNATESDTDFLIFIEQLPNGERSITWQVGLDWREGASNPSAGKVATITTEKPFLENDEFEFTASQPEIDQEEAKNDLDDVVVVPNPYQGASVYEQRSAYRYGRERAIQFKNLPARCTIRIFDNSGHLVDMIQHGGEGAAGLMNGTAQWDLKSQDGLDVSYGLYLYHVDAPDIGETTGTFAIIK